MDYAPVVTLVLVLLCPVWTTRFCPSQCTCEPSVAPARGFAVQCCGQKLQKIPEKLEDVENIATLNVSENAFASIPSHLPLSLTKLDMSRNALTALKGEGDMSLHRLEELYLNHNNVSSVRRNDFSQMSATEEAFPNLRKLILDHNSISHVEPAAFRWLPMLQILRMSHNNLEKISAAELDGLAVLELIDLSHNSMRVVEKGTFRNMPSLQYVYLNWNKLTSYPEEVPMLEWLDLSHNSIKYIDEKQKGDVYPVETINLAHNPLVCDCALLWLKELYDRREFMLKYIDIAMSEFVPTCAEPADLAGESWDVLGDNVFHCEETEEELDLENIMFKDPFEERETATIEPDKPPKKDFSYEFLVNVYASVARLEARAAKIRWILDDPDQRCKTLYVHYHQLGERDSTLLIAPVSSEQNSYVLRHLEPDTSYKACVLPATKKSEVPTDVISEQQCVQFVTPFGKGTESARKSSQAKSLWRMPTSDEITVYTKLLLFSILLAIVLTGVFLFVYEVFCYFSGCVGDDTKRTVKKHAD